MKTDSDQPATPDNAGEGGGSLPPIVGPFAPDNAQWVLCAVSDPPPDRAVWLYDANRKFGPWIGALGEIEFGAWQFGNSYGSFWWTGEFWDCDNEVDDDYTPTHWMPLPLLPNVKDDSPPVGG